MPPVMVALPHPGENTSYLPCWLHITEAITSEKNAELRKSAYPDRIICREKCQKFMMGGVDFIPELNLWGKCWYLRTITVRFKKISSINRQRVKKDG